jgi:hypothetical protein
MSAAPNTWPEVGLDPVARLRVLAAGLPHVHLVEHILEAPFDAVWAVAGDLEAAPAFETLVGDVRILERNGSELQLESRVGPARFRLGARLEDGFCLMHGNGFDVGMAACPEPDGRTRFAHYEGIRWLGRLAHPWLRWTLPRELRAIEKLAQAR